MNIHIKTAALSFFLLAAQHCCATEYASSDLRFKKEIYRQSGPKDEINRIYLEKITMQASRRLGKIQAMRINKEIDKLYEAIYSEARYCRDPLVASPWGYEAELAHINLEGDTLSVIFKIAGACYSQPHFDKVAGNFSIRSGAVISQRKMLKMYAPDLLKAGVTFDPNFISLSEDAVQYLLEQNEDLFKSEAMASCESYFRSAAFHIWLRDGALILTPGFSHPNSICFKAYSIRPS